MGRGLIFGLVMAGASAALLLASCSNGSDAAAGPAAGSERGPCYGNGTCDMGLVCRSERCVAPASSGGDAGTVGVGASHTGASGGVDGSGGSGANTAAGEAPSGGTKAAGGTKATGGAGGSQPNDGGAGSTGAGGEPDPGSTGDAVSCAGLAASCGPAANENCCSSLLVPGGTFFRGYDGLEGSMKTAPATLSAFRLDRYEVTVARFRGFVAAWLAGWRPAAGAGKHAHLNAGKGLTTTAGGYEPGWIETMGNSFPTTKTAWDSSLSCGGQRYTWTSAPGTNENVPVNCITWAEADAFCIWDGGFLPSDAESSYASAGGDEQRAFPWSVPASSLDIECAYANYSTDNSGYCVQPQTGAANAVGSESPKGDARFGQADLSGNVSEWVLDHNATYVSPCTDCVEYVDTYQRIARGGSFNSPAAVLRTTYRGATDGTLRSVMFGARCARAPE